MKFLRKNEYYYIIMLIIIDVYKNPLKWGFLTALAAVFALPRVCRQKKLKFVNNGDQFLMQYLHSVYPTFQKVRYCSKKYIPNTESAFYISPYLLKSPLSVYDVAYHVLGQSAFNISNTITIGLWAGPALCLCNPVPPYLTVAGHFLPVGNS